ncbi:hypothetical protein FF100_22195 [Methylobacterium terricola]|uniref:Uncharacterized protein n=1 Tax=Methylobacterium terricola TaxID=2583531 RepID=A0A5C4LF75_9HYPH|nr:hypothetical protein [Methylobacterium terricola]TNC10865.1 hypothetical protein FF100_22195 [Methylobacterium terricola]
MKTETPTFTPMRRDKKRGYYLNDRAEKASLNALVEGFRRGSYILPRSVRRFLRRPLEAYQGRPRLAKAISILANLIGRFHTGEHNFVQRGCGIGGEGAGFFLSRKGLCGPNGFQGLTEALVREATQVLIQIGFIERITPAGELTEVRAPKNAKTPFGYFRRGLKAKKDALGRIRSPMVMYRLGPDTRQLFAKTLRRTETRGEGAVGEPLWSNSVNILDSEPGGNRAGKHSGSSYDDAGHDPGDPRFHRYRPNPDRDPLTKRRWPDAVRLAEMEKLEQWKRGPKPNLAFERHREAQWRLPTQASDPMPRLSRGALTSRFLRGDG